MSIIFKIITALAIVIAFFGLFDIIVYTVKKAPRKAVHSKTLWYMTYISTFYLVLIYLIFKT